MTKSQAIIGLVGVAVVIGVLVFVSDETTRFTLIMPIFAGYIFYLILTTDFEDEEESLSEALTVKVPKQEKITKKKR